MYILLSWLLVGFSCGVFSIYYHHITDDSDITLYDVVMNLCIFLLFGFLSVLVLLDVLNIPQKVARWFSRLDKVVVLKSKNKKP